MSVKDGKKITICRDTTLTYTASSTVGDARCKVKKKASGEKGSLGDKDKLTCTNKPVGSDTDKFKIKATKVHHFEKSKDSNGWHRGSNKGSN